MNKQNSFNIFHSSFLTTKLSSQFWNCNVPVTQQTLSGRRKKEKRHTKQ